MGFEDLLQLLVELGVGRLTLSLLAPGWPGIHDRRELGPTLCASLVLGAGTWSLLPFYGPWLALALLRLATLPGALRPRHDRRRHAAWEWELLFLTAVALRLWAIPFEGAATWLLAIVWSVAGLLIWRKQADRRARQLCWLAPLAALLETLL